MNIGIKSVKLASSYHPRYFTIYTVFHFNKILSFLLLKSMPSPKSIESLLSTDSWLGDVNSYQIIFDFIYIFMLVKNNYHQHRDIYALVPDKVCRLFVFNLFRPNPGRREKIKLNFYFYISLWCLKRFYEYNMPARFSP